MEQPQLPRGEQRAAAMKWMSVRATVQAVQAKGHKISHEGVARVLRAAET